MIMMVLPVKMVFFLPSMLPSQIVATAPKKHLHPVSGCTGRAVMRTFHTRACSPRL